MARVDPPPCRAAYVNHVLVDEPGILPGNHVTREVGICLQALTRGISPAGWVQMPVGKSSPAAGTFNQVFMCISDDLHVLNRAGERRKEPLDDRCHYPYHNRN